jgi:hypothetical protein
MDHTAPGWVAGEIIGALEASLHEILNQFEGTPEELIPMPQKVQRIRWPFGLAAQSLALRPPGAGTLVILIPPARSPRPLYQRGARGDSMAGEKQAAPGCITV